MVAGTAEVTIVRCSLLFAMGRADAAVHVENDHLRRMAVMNLVDPHPVQLVPEDHVLARVDRVLDLGGLREEVADCYCVDNGRPGIDPEVRGAADARRPSARHRARPQADAGSSGQHRDPVVHRLRVARASARPFEPDADPPTLGRGAVPGDFPAYGRGLSVCEDRHGRGSARRCLPHPARAWRCLS